MMIMILPITRLAIAVYILVSISNVRATYLHKYVATYVVSYVAVT